MGRYADADSLQMFQQDARAHALAYAAGESSGWKAHLDSRNDAQYVQAKALAASMQTRAIADYGAMHPLYQHLTP